MHTSSRDEHRPGLAPPQFGLRTLFMFVAMLCIVLALGKTFGAITAFAASLFLLTLAAHIAGNALGTRLRDNGAQRTSAGSHPSTAVQQPLTSDHFAPTTGLSESHRLGKIVLAVIIAGAILGGGFGVWILNWSIGNKANWANMSFGTTAFAAIGGFLGFLIGSFLKVMLAANVEAWKTEKSTVRQDTDPS